MDGLVTLGGPSAIHVLKAARQRAQNAGPAGSVKAEWIDEAIQQIEEEGIT